MHEDEHQSTTLSSARQAIHQAFFDDETQILSKLPQLSFTQAEHQDIQKNAETLSEGLTRSPFWQLSLNQLLHNYSLRSAEGQALVNIAEAYLRIPDQETKLRFLIDQLSHAQWLSHVHPDNGFLVNSIGRIMEYTKRTFQWAHAGTNHSMRHYAGSTVRHVGAWVTEQLIHFIGRSFIMGRTLEEGQRKAGKKRPFVFSYDMLGEAALTENDALRNYLRYMNAVARLGQHQHKHPGHQGPTDNISIKLSSLFPGYHEYFAPRILPRLLVRVSEICHLAAYYNIDVTIDAEESDNLNLTMDVMTALTEDTSLAKWQGLGCAVQAYQKNALAVLDYLALLAKTHHKPIKVRLVKGAYWDGEIMQAQAQALGYFPVFTQKVHTDVHYLLCAQSLLRYQPHLFPRFATHNAITLSYLLTMAKKEGTEKLEFQSLYSTTGEQLYRNVLSRHPKHTVRFYAPIGIYPELLPYLVRRIIENGANSSFIQQLLDPSQHHAKLPEIGSLLDHTQGRSHPDIRHPHQLFMPHWANAHGINLAWRLEHQRLKNAVDEWSQKSWEAQPTHRDPEDNSDIHATHVYSPANLFTVLGKIQDTRPSDIDYSLQVLSAHQTQWATLSPAERAQHLEAIAQSLEADAYPLVALCVHEAGKTLANAWGDLREAIDFCRYYAHCLRSDQVLSLRQPQGIMASISPWNFPIAIFTGQVVASLAMGNAVIAKAAEQTQLIACHIIACMHKAGIPREVLAFVTGSGSTTGAAIVAHPEVAGVVFTGSNATAQRIAKCLYEKSPQATLIAETGGLNVMMVDSTALPEKVVRDAVVSAFDSAGQRCSALRVLCLQEEIADTIITMLFGALKEYHIGHPIQLSHHYGPLISQEAKKDIQDYIQHMKELGFPIRQYGHLDPNCQGHYLLPTVIEVERFTDVEKEVFGPVLHVLRYRYAERHQLIEAINASGYHLTFGFHSRIQSDITEITNAIQAGNIYINRTTIGAQVCSQPFGGDQRSGTGPKAGGPLYLHRLGKMQNISKHSPSLTLPYLAEQLLNWADTFLSPEECHRLKTGYLPWQQEHTEQCLRVPSGESNTWKATAQSQILLLPLSLYDAVAQMMACLLVSGQAQVDASTVPELTTHIPGLPSALRPCFTLVQSSTAHQMTILIHPMHPQLGPYVARSTHVEGTLCSFVTPSTADGLYDPWRLLHEQTVSINTAAIGANTDLMMITNA